MSDLAAPTRAFAEPTVNPPGRWVTALVLLNLAITAGWFGPIQVLLAEQAKAIWVANPAGLSKEAILAVVLLSGATVSMVSNPVWGALSDRTRLPVGRRLPWVVGGMATGAVALFLVAQVHTIWALTLGWCLVQLTLNAAWAAMTAAVPDQVPVARRGLVGGLIAVAGTVGVIVGVEIANVTGSIAQGYLVIIGVMLVLSVPYLLWNQDLAVPPEHVQEPFALGAMLRSFWVSPREHPDFAWAWLTRLLVNLGNWIGLNYLFYFLTDGLGFTDSDANAKLVLLTGIYGVTVVATTVIVGHLSDRAGRRKPYVIWSGVVVGISSLILGLSQTYPATILAAMVMGCGYGIYQAVDFALITQVLPGAEERAKDLGVINIAAALPQVLAPAIAGGILVLVRWVGGSVITHGDHWSLGYGVVYLVGFLVCLLGSVFVTRIKSVA